MALSQLKFKYSVFMRVVFVIAAPVLPIMDIALPAAACFPFISPDATLTEQVAAWFVFVLTPVLWWVTFHGARDFADLFRTYLVGADGVSFMLGSSKKSFPWTALRQARYRQSLGQLELKFDGYKKLVILTNVDMDLDRKTILAAVSLVRRYAPGRLASTFL